MAHFYESILNNKIDFDAEFKKLVRLFLSEEFYISQFDAGRTTLMQFIETYYFRKLKISYNYISLRQCLEDILQSFESDADKFILFCEVILSIIPQFWDKYQSEEEIYLSDKQILDEKMVFIKKIIVTDLEAINLIEKRIENNRLGTISTIIPNDLSIEQALSLVDDENVRTHLIEYNSLRNRGNIQAKTEILRLISNYIEGITKDKNLIPLFKKLFEDTNFLFNNLDLRHNKNVNDIKFYKATLKEREKWLDYTYKNSIMVINAKEQNNIHNKISKLRSVQS